MLPEDRTPHIDRGWQEDAVLRDGTPVHLRWVRPEDKPLFERGLRRLSPTSRYRRFLAPKATLTPSELAYLTEFDGWNHLALGAIGRLDGEEVGLGVARFVRLPDRPETAEAAVVVLDEAQGRGLGSLLLTRLAEAASERGIRRFSGELLAHNEPVLALLRELAPDAHIQQSPDGDAEESFTVDLELPREVPHDGPLRRALRLAAEGVVSLRRSLAGD